MKQTQSIVQKIESLILEIKTRNEELKYLQRIYLLNNDEENQALIIKELQVINSLLKKLENILQKN